MLDVVTGAFGFSGSYIARRLLAAGRAVRTLTNSPHRESPLRQRIEARRYAFDDADELTDALRGAEVLYNTYWVRFDRAGSSHERAVANSVALFEAAKRAGVHRIVHVSITNPSEDSHLSYFSGKARVEEALRASDVPHTILRPALLFGDEDVLINNIAWALRRFPVIGVFGDGEYQLQPIHVDDLAKLAVEEGEAAPGRVVDAIGPETFTFRELVATIGRLIGVRRPIVSLPPRLAYLVARAMGALLGDVVLTWQEVEGLMEGLLYTDSPPVGGVRLTEWVGQHASVLGRSYSSELARRRDRTSSYTEL